MADVCREWRPDEQTSYDDLGDTSETVASARHTNHLADQNNASRAAYCGGQP